MDSTLIGVTLLSMTMAGVLSAIVWRMLRIERRRSEARVMALAELATHEQPAPPAHGPHREHAAPRPARPARQTHDFTLWDKPVAVTTPLFEERAPSSSPWGTRLAVMTGLGLAMAALILFTLAAREGSGEIQSRQTAQPVAAAASPAPGLELLSLRDTRQPGTLTITGLVQNPRDGAMLTRVTVTAFAFDENGAFLASGRALLDVTALAPGDESPFVVTVPVTDGVARYRIGFRGDDGRVIAHIDRRQQGAIAVADRRALAGI